MGTLVFKTGSGPVQQVQIGAADIVAASSAATSAWGWVGGFAGIRHILANIPNPFSKSTITKVFRCPEFRPGLCHILTFKGVVHYQDGCTNDAFGGDLRTQFLGLTICALEHECGATQAINIFMHCLAPALLLRPDREIPGVREALYTQLHDNSQKILNEGAFRGLPQQFIQAIASLQLPDCHHEYRKYNQSLDDPLLPEISMIGGLLIWIGKQHEESYFTRSAMVARVAACLRSVGYKIGQIRTWDGQGDSPVLLRGVILVIAGSTNTDPYILDSDVLEEQLFRSHYQSNTTGALLINALHLCCDELPESFQTWFEDIQKLIRTSLDFHWEWSAANGRSSIKIVAGWRTPTDRPPSWSTRLASLEFANIADRVAHCYILAGSEHMLRVVLKTKDNWIDNGQIPRELIRYRIITASILLAIVGRLTDPGFDNLHHATTLNLNRPHWISKMAQYVSRGIEHGFLIRTAVALIATIHCGVDPEELGEELLTSDQTYSENSEVIGWRNGIYTVVPSLLFEMAPTQESIGFHCSDIFIGNLPVHDKGLIRSSHERRMTFSESSDRGPLSIEGVERCQAAPPIVVCSPVAAASDVEMYINIERIFQTQDPDLCFCGRVGGEVLGVVSVTAILSTLLRSFRPRIQCRGHENPAQAEIMPASFWANNRWVRDRLMSKSVASHNHHTYVPVSGNSCWTLFLAGQIDSSQGVVSEGCFDCAVAKRSNAYQKEGNLIVIGYQ